MRKNKDWNFEKESLLNKVNFKILILVMVMGLAYAVLFEGCAATQTESKETLECIDGSLYKVSKQKVELLLLGSCDQGKITLRGF